MNKKMFSLLVISFAFFAIGLVSAEGYLSLKMLKYEDFPASPGEYFDLWIQLSSLNNMDYLKLELIEESPFSMDNDAELIKEYTDFSGNTLLQYKIRVSQDAVEGENQLKFKVYTDKNGNYTIESFPIFISEVQTDFDLIIQESSDNDVSVAITNIGKNTANSLIVKVPQQDAYSASGTNGQMVGNLESGDYTIVSFTLVPKGKSENLQIELDYTDRIGERRTLIKEVSYSSSSPVPNATFSRPSPGTFNTVAGFPGQQTSTSVFKTFWFWGIIVAVLAIVGYFSYKKGLFQKSKK